MTLNNKILKKQKKQYICFSIFKFFCYERTYSLPLEKSPIFRYIRQLICSLLLTFIKTDSLPNSPTPPRTSIMKTYLRFLLTKIHISFLAKKVYNSKFRIQLVKISDYIWYWKINSSKVIVYLIFLISQEKIFPPILSLR